MTAASKVFLAQLAAHIGNDTAKKKALCAFVGAATKKPLHRSALHNYLYDGRKPTLDIAIPMMRWMQLQGVIVPLPKEQGLFAYSNPLKKPKSGVKKPAKRG